MAPFLVIDAGNSRIHVAVWTGSRCEKGRSFPADALRGKLEDLGFGTDVTEAAFASVNEDASRWLRSWAAAKGVVLRQVPGDIPYPIALQVSHPDRVGPDRVLAAAAALARTGRDGVVVDAGTATTVDLVTKDHGFEGGAILPGPALQAAALARGTSRLPEVAIRSVSAPLGRSTQDAILAGVVIGWLGAVRELVGRHRKRDASMPVIVTGGNADLLANVLDEPVLFVEDLVLEGLAAAVEKDRHGAAPETRR